MGKKGDERGNVRYLWVLVGGYLLYLAWQQAQVLLRGDYDNATYALIFALSGIAFAAVGAFVLFREWASWRRSQKAKDQDDETEDAS